MRRRGWRSHVLVALGLFIIVVGVFFLFAPYYSTHLWWSLRSAWFWAIPLLVVALVLLLAIGAESFGLFGLAGLMLLAWIFWLFQYNYQQDQVYAKSVAITEDAVPALKERAPYSVSTSQVRSNLGDVPGDVQETSYVPAEETFSTLVEQRGFSTGYRTLLRQEISTTGRNAPSVCDFTGPGTAKRVGGWLGGNLGRAINTEVRWVNWSDSDTYGYCKDGVPYVVVPLVEQEGVLIITEKPYGAAQYNGKTGELRILRSGEEMKGVPGPSYPLSLAATQRESVAAISGFWDWAWNRAGWELPDEADSVNSGNDSEFTLAGVDGGEYYAAMLSSRGNATAISAISVLDANYTGPDLNRITFHRLSGSPSRESAHPVWQSPTAITQRIQADFGDVFARQPGAALYELIPTGSDTWVATFGTPQNMLYRIGGRGDLSKDPCLIALTGETVRCGRVAGGPGLAVGPGNAPTAPAASDLSTLSPGELADLNRRIGEELARRATGGGS